MITHLLFSEHLYFSINYQPKYPIVTINNDRCLVERYKNDGPWNYITHDV